MFVRVEGLFVYAYSKSNVEDTFTAYDWGGSLSVLCLLPGCIRLETVFPYIKKRGYGDGYNYSEAILNGILSRRIFLSGKLGEGILRFTSSD